MIPHEAFEMLRAYNHVTERSWSPLSTGRASWLPGLYIEAVEVVAAAVSEKKAEAQRRRERSGV